jgi:hypothetical protein
LGTPARLGQRKNRHQQQRRADVQNQVPQFADVKTRVPAA